MLTHIDLNRSSSKPVAPPSALAFHNRPSSRPKLHFGRRCAPMTHCRFGHNESDHISFQVWSDDLASQQTSEAADPSANTSVPQPIKASHQTPRPLLSPRKADFYILRTDGKSCTRETIKAPGTISFAHPSTNQYLLVWQNRPRRAMVLKKPAAPDVDECFIQLVEYLGKKERLRVIVEQHEYEKLVSQGSCDFVETFGDLESQRLHDFVDFVVCLGGDGVLLHASNLFPSGSPPIISFNLGSMGFLTNHDFAHFQNDIQQMLCGCQDVSMCNVDSLLRGVYITLRMRLRCEVYRYGEAEPSNAYEVLNEVVVNRGQNPYLTLLECWEQNTLITQIQADGVMLATPTGSTAYSVAAGGSMVHPGVNAILLTPVCPHSLSFRPIILPDYADLELRVPKDARCSAWVCFDGKHRQELGRGDRLRVRMSQHPLPTVNLTDQTTDWFGSLQKCFGWNNRTVQKPLAPLFEQTETLSSFDTISTSSPTIGSFDSSHSSGTMNSMDSGCQPSAGRLENGIMKANGMVTD